VKFECFPEWIKLKPFNDIHSTLALYSVTFAIATAIAIATANAIATYFSTATVTAIANAIAISTYFSTALQLRPRLRLDCFQIYQPVFLFFSQCH
jgi:hypothetical protein